MKFKLNIDCKSPFQSKLQFLSFFKGRPLSIQKILKYYNNTYHNDVHHFFLTRKKQ